MIRGLLHEDCPFPLPDLIWRAAIFVPQPAQELVYITDDAVLQIDLPETLRQAVPKRRSEFLAGRLCAAAALNAIGLPYRVGMRGRAPVWPSPANGSISHTDGYAVAVVSLAYAFLGVDCERIMSPDLVQSLHSSFLSKSELVKCPHGLDFPTYATVVFSAKEALYKAISSHVGRMIDFHDVTVISITIDTLDLLFENRLYRVHWTIVDNTCLTLLAASS